MTYEIFELERDTKEISIEQAILNLQQQQWEFNDNYVDFAGVNAAYDYAIELLNKQIPKPRKVIPDPNYLWQFQCPVCDQILSPAFSFCPHCGQAVEQSK